jgi:DMSO/TMAO reductase YedYZ molybdopterin-dependent catalytic subunit
MSDSLKNKLLSRRSLVWGAAVGAGALGYAALPSGSLKKGFLSASEGLTLHTQRFIMGKNALVREFSPADISREFPTNGTKMPEGEDYQRLLATSFEQFTLKVDGLVAMPFSASLSEVKAMPSRTQITMHTCDEGWNAIGQWKGVQLGHLLNRAGVLPEARYVVFHCLDKQGDGAFYYESIDLFDAYHPQTILAYEMNGQPLPTGHGAPLRLRVELQIGYKNAKYVDRIELVDTLSRTGKGRGGWWEDTGDAVWYAGQ